MAKRKQFSWAGHRILPYAVALLLSLTAFALRLSLAPLLQLDVPFLTFLGAVILSAWYGGTGPALFAVVLSAVLANYCCVPPYNEFSFDQLGITSMLLFMVEAVGLVWLMATLRRRATLLEASQAKFEMFTNSITDAYVVVDANWVYTEVNDKAESILGSSREQFIGRNIWACFPEYVGTTVWQEMHRAMTSRDRVQFETYSNRSHRWFESRVYPYADGLTVLFTDITDRKAAEAAAREAEERLQLVSNTVPALISYVDTNLRFVTCNDAYTKWFGLSKHDVIGKTIAEVVGDEAWGRIHPYVKEALTGKYVECEAEMPYRHGPGRWIHAAYTPHHDRDGHLAGFVAMVTNITEQKATERALRESEKALRASEQYFREMADAAPAMLWVTNDLHETIFISRGWREYTKQENDAGLGFGWTDALHPDDRTKAAESFLDAAARRESFALQYRLRRNDGEYRWVLDAGRPRFTADGIWVGYIGSVIDVHERIQAEEQLRVFAGHLESLVNERTHELVQSHERLRALATELNLAELRERKRLATELHDYLQQMLVLAKLKLGHSKYLDPPGVGGPVFDELDTLLSDALKYTRSLVADLSPSVLRDHGLAASLRWLSEYMTKYDLRVTLDGPEQETSAIPEEQSALIFQCVRELLINTSKHAGTRDAHVSIDEQDGWISVVVRDQGVGFDERALTSATIDGGTLSSKFGLLSIQERMRALGGGFDIRSTPGQGTTATLRLPVSAATVCNARSAALTSDRYSGEQEEMTAPSVARGIARILLVDDHAMVRQGLRTLLDGYGDVTVVGEAGDGDDAVHSAGYLQPDVVVMDVNMPIRSGIEATAEIKKRYPHIEVIGLSVNTTLETQKAMQAAGAVMLLTKEAAVENLYKAIQDVWRDGRPAPTARPQ